MVLQEVKKSTLSHFDDKRCYRNETESIPSNLKSYQNIIFYFYSYICMKKFNCSFYFYKYYFVNFLKDYNRYRVGIFSVH